jgi:hypothetical protein
MSRSSVLAVVSIAAFLLIEPRPAFDDEPAKGDAAAKADIWRTYDFHVVSQDGSPVAGAKVSPWQVAYGRGSMGLGKPLESPLTTDAEGKFQLAIPKDAAFIPTIETYGIRSLAFHIDHPNHPTWSDYVPVEGDRKIHLPDSATITVRVQPAVGTEAPRDLYPVPTTSDWSEQDGVVTIRRMDLQSKSNSQWLRIVQAPQEGPQSFTELINLRQHEGPTVMLDVKLMPGVRVVGRLADNATRPIKNGRALATINSGGRANGRVWTWRVATNIDEDGNFIFETLPAGDTVQIIAISDGWVSASSTSREVADYGEANNFATEPLDDRQMKASNRVYPRLYRLTPPEIEPVLPMEATLSCMVTVVDDNGLPIPDAKVSFSPNQYSFDGGSQLLGVEGNSLEALRASRRRTGENAFRYSRAENSRYQKTTDAGGIVVISGLPFALSSAATLTRQYGFYVSHNKYQLPAEANGKVLRIDNDLSVKIEPGQLGQIEVRMVPK